MKENYINSVILVVVATGTALVAFVSDGSPGAEPLQTMFLAFLAAIISIQIVPAVILIGGLIKSLLHRPEKAVER